MKKINLLPIAFIIFAFEIFALGGGTSNADFLKIGVGARPEAMGEAFIGVADDANAVFWNASYVVSRNIL